MSVWDDIGTIIDPLGGPLGKAVGSIGKKVTGEKKASGNDDGMAANAIIEQMIADGKMNMQQALAAIEAFREGGLKEFANEIDRANIQDAKTVLQQSDFFKRQAEIKGWDAPDLLTSEAAKAVADPEGRAAQRAAVEKLGGLTDPTMTAQERFMQAQARQAQERDARAGREAAIRRLQARGADSAAGEMAAQAAAYESTANNRLMGDLGAQANAVDRAMLATQLYGEQGGQLAGDVFREQYDTGQATDAINRFNTEMSADYQQKLADFKLRQQDSRFDRMDRLTKNRMTATDNRTRRAGDKARLDYGATGLEVGALTGPNPQTEALRIALGAEEADKARADLQPKKKGFLEGLF